MIWETVWPIFGSGAYCPYTALMWTVWPISCQYIAYTVANIWAPKSFLGGTIDLFGAREIKEKKFSEVKCFLEVMLQELRGQGVNNISKLFFF